MKRITTTSGRRALFFLSFFLVSWSIFTVWLNLKHQEEIKIISRSHDLSLSVTHTSDVLIASHVTGYPQVHKLAIETYQTQLRELQKMKKDLMTLWPGSGSTLVTAIDDAHLAYKDLIKNPQSYALHEKFSQANVYYKNMSFHEFSRAKRNLLHQNLPLFLILAVAVVLLVRYVEKSEFNWSFSQIFLTEKA